MVGSLFGPLLLGETAMASKRIGVIGAGAIGSTLAAHLAHSGREVVLVESGPRLAQVRELGVAVGGVREIPTQRPTVLAAVDELADVPLEALFICTKVWSLRSLLAPLCAALDPEAEVVSFQNGIGPEEELAACFGRRRVCRGVVNFAGGVTPAGDRVELAWFTPPNYLGPLEADDVRAPALAQLLTEIGLQTKLLTAHEVKTRVFWKAILNAALMPLCASTGITMRKAMTTPHTRSLARRVIREGLAVASAMGYQYGENALDEALAYLDRGGDHMPSMWVDLQHDLPTEIEYINGKIVQLGRMFSNVDVEANAFLSSMIVTLEIKSGARPPDRIPDYLINS
jgi:2-dehydropantoate 2-reductase